LHTKKSCVLYVCSVFVSLNFVQYCVCVCVCVCETRLNLFIIEFRHAVNNPGLIASISLELSLLTITLSKPYLKLKKAQYMSTAAAQSWMIKVYIEITGRMPYKEGDRWVYPPIAAVLSTNPFWYPIQFGLVATGL